MRVCRRIIAVCHPKMSSRRIVREGYLTKSPPPDKLMAKWHERFFVLWSTQVMEYYTTKDKRAQDYCKSIDLGHCDDIIAPSRIGSRECVIMVRMSHPRGRDYMFDCGNETNMKAWVEALNTVCKHVGPTHSSNHASDRTLPGVPPSTAESPSSDEGEGELLYEECIDQSFSQPYQHPGNRCIEAKNSPPEGRRLPVRPQLQQQQDLPTPDDDPEQTYEELDDMQPLDTHTQRPPLKTPTKSLVHPASNVNVPPDTKKRPPAPPPKPQVASCEESDQQENYEELNDMQPLTTPTQRPPLKTPTKSLVHPASNVNVPPDTKKRPPAPPPKPQVASCEESDQQENYEELNDMQPSVISKQRLPPKLPTKSLPNPSGVALPGLDLGKRSPLPPFKPQHTEFEQQENYEVPVDTRKFPSLNVPDHQEVEEPLNMTMKKPIMLNPLLKQTLDVASKKIPVKPKQSLATSAPRENNFPVQEEDEEEPKQEEMYETMESSAPPLSIAAPLHVEGWGSTPRHVEGRGSTPKHTSSKSAQGELRSPQPYEDFVSARSYEEPIMAKTSNDSVVARKQSGELVSSPVAKHRELKGANGKDPAGSRDGPRVKGKQVSNDDVSHEVTGVQQRALTYRGKSGSSPTLPSAEEDAPPDVPRRVESIGQSNVADGIDPPPPPPPPRTTSINSEEEELSRRNEPPALPGRRPFIPFAGEEVSKRRDLPPPSGRKGSVPMSEDEHLKRSERPALPGRNHSSPTTGEESPKRGGSPQSNNATFSDESPDPPRRNAPKSSSQVENATMTNDRSRTSQNAQSRMALSDSNWMPAKDAGTRLTPPSESPLAEEPTRPKPSPVRPSVMPKPSTMPPPTPPQKASLHPSVQPKRPESPGANIMKPLAQPTPKPRTHPRSPDEGRSVDSKELRWRKNPPVIIS